MKILLTSAMALGVIVMFGATQPTQAAADSQQGQVILAGHGHGGHHGGGHHGHWGGHHRNWGGGGYWGGYYGPSYYYGPGYYYSSPYYYYDSPGLCVGPLCIF